MFIFKYAESHMTMIFLGAGLLYFVGFGLMCFRVKEGEYPPPPEYVDGQACFLSGLKTFFVECFSLRFYWFMFGMTTFANISYLSGSLFNVFFVKDIGMNLEQYGKILAYAGFIGMLLTYPAGIVIDKYHPLRVQLAMKIVWLLFTPLFLVFIFIKMSPQAAYQYYLIVALAQIPAAVLYGAAGLPTEMRIFPKERFGQFCSAQAMVRSIGVILGSLLAGLFFDGLKWYYNGSDFAYRWVPAWTWSFELLSFLCLIRVYYGWKHYGGLKNYTPPLLERKNQSPVTQKEPQGLIEPLFEIK